MVIFSPPIPSSLHLSPQVKRSRTATARVAPPRARRFGSTSEPPHWPRRGVVDPGRGQVLLVIIWWNNGEIIWLIMVNMVSIWCPKLVKMGLGRWLVYHLSSFTCCWRGKQTPLNLWTNQWEFGTSMRRFCSGHGSHWRVFYETADNYCN